MQIYLDYNATAPLLPAARDAVVAGLELYNASSVHAFGRAARSAVTESRNILADFLSVRPAQIIFTSGATESIVTALRGCSASEFIIGGTEHEAVRTTTEQLSLLPTGRRETLIAPVHANGVINLEQLESLLKNSTHAILGLQYVNNETGVIQPVTDAIALAKKYNASILIDAVQALGKLDMAACAGADMIALSAHKMGGPKGVGALILREGLSISPLITGGGQEERRRAGTENVAAIMGFGAAVENISASMDKQNDLAAWRDAMESEIAAALPHVKIFNTALRAANTSMIALPGAAAATQLMNLDLSGIAVSSGAACSSGKVGPSHSLTAMGEPERTAASALRISGGWNSSQKDFQTFARSYIEMANRLA